MIYENKVGKRRVKRGGGGVNIRRDLRKQSCQNKK